MMRGDASGGGHLTMDHSLIIHTHTDGGDDSGDSFKLDSDDSFFSIPDYVPSELPDLAALGSGKSFYTSARPRVIII